METPSLKTQISILESRIAEIENIIGICAAPRPEEKVVCKTKGCNNLLGAESHKFDKCRWCRDKESKPTLDPEELAKVLNMHYLELYDANMPNHSWQKIARNLIPWLKSKERGEAS